MSTGRIRERFKAALCHNTYNVIAFAINFGGIEHGVFVKYRYQQTGRAYQSAAWQVMRPGVKTDPKAHWQDHGNKTFYVYTPVRESKEPQRLAAIEWASKRYGFDPQDWVRSPFSDAWLPRSVLDAALRGLDEYEAALDQTAEAD
jgi:hypothetical protein